MRKSCALNLITALGLSLTAMSAIADTTYVNPLTNGEGLTGFGTTVAPVTDDGAKGLQLVVDPDHKGLQEGGCDNCTVALVDDLQFGDGSIEVTLSGNASAGAPPNARGFVGLVFRAAADGSRYEGVYLRPLNSNDSVQERRNFTVQYFSYPDHYWRKLREETPGRYESWAPVHPGEWTKMRVDVAGGTAKVYVDDIDIPVLVVNDLKLGADQRGTVGLFTEPQQDAYFRDLRVAHSK